MSINLKDLANRVKGDIGGLADNAVRSALTTAGQNQKPKTAIKPNNPFLDKLVPKTDVTKTVITTDTYTKVMELLNSWFIKYPLIALIFAILLNYLWSLVQW